MKTVEWTDERGYDHRALIRDEDSKMVAQKGMGISLDPPDVDMIDWEKVKRNLHNLLLVHGLTSFSAVNTSRAPLGAVLIKALKREVIALFKSENQ